MKEYSFFPGCSSEHNASAANMETSVRSMCRMLDIKLNEIEDWNCCSASIGYAGGGVIPRLALSARNFALSKQQQGNSDLVATCAACWLSMRETSERLEHEPEMKEKVNIALKEGGLSYEGGIKTRHLVEVLIEDIGWNTLKGKVTKPLTGLKVAGYVGCQTNRPFGIVGDSFENPQYLDRMITLTGATAIPFAKKVACCGGALMFSEQERSCQLTKEIIQCAVEGGADCIVTPCPVCQLNLEVYQGKINQLFGTSYNIPILYYSQLMVLSWGGSWNDAALHQQVVQPDVLKKFA
ncbi:MAG: heterodisulfide reductase subunit B [Magnetococcales bacterium]|nr:heterodisulfide reductase subunit B [Magnetococcales bacterium]